MEVDIACVEVFDRVLGIYGLAAASCMLADLQIAGRVPMGMVPIQADFSQSWLPVKPIYTHNIARILRESYGRA